MFIDFEGIDGSGKTTLSNRVAERLRALGYRVCHAREGGELQSSAARRIRELTRDARHLELGPEAEFFLNLARDSQQRVEVIQPALARGELVITDRYVPSQLSLTGAGRGIPLAKLEGAAELASGGLWPDLIVLVDVDPDLARLRKRLGKARAQKTSDGDSRKGLAGAGLAVRAREGFLALAKKHPDQWLIVQNDEQPLAVLEQRILDAILARLTGREVPLERVVPQVRAAASITRASEVPDRFYSALDAVEVREPMLGVWLLGGMPGLAAHQRRLASLERFPDLVARSLGGLCDEESDQLREILADLCPAEVAGSLNSENGPAARALREKLFDRAPREVLTGLKRNDSDEAWALRERGLDRGLLSEVTLSVTGLESSRAWEVREKAVRERLISEAARSLTSVNSMRADALREALFTKDRLAVLRSVGGLDTPLAWGLRQQLLPYAPKLVLRTLAGIATAEADEMRAKGARHTKEAIDALDGLGHAQAFALREEVLMRWPTTVISSLRGLPMDARVESLILRALKSFPRKLPLLRNACRVVLCAQPPARLSNARPTAFAGAHV